MATQTTYDLPVAPQSAAAAPVLAAAPSTPTPQDQIVAALRGIAQLDGLTDAEYRWLATHSTERMGPDGAMIFREDEASANCDRPRPPR